MSSTQITISLFVVVACLYYVLTTVYRLDGTRRAAEAWHVLFP